MRERQTSEPQENVSRGESKSRDFPQRSDKLVFGIHHTLIFFPRFSFCFSSLWRKSSLKTSTELFLGLGWLDGGTSPVMYNTTTIQTQDDLSLHSHKQITPETDRKEAL